MHAGTGRSFWKKTNDKKWQNARNDCKDDGGELAVFETQELFDFVKAEFG